MEAAATSASARMYHDMQGLAALRSEASATPQGAIKEVAGQFESLFTQMMLKSMRDATIDGGLFDSNQMELYQSMFDQQISLDLSRDNALGLRDILINELGGEVSKPVTQSPPTTFPQAVPSVDTRSASTAPTSGNSQQTALSDQATGQAIPVSDTSPSRWSPETPEEFIQGVWDHAVDAARKLGLDPMVLVAQSALETGWGKRVIQAIDGSSSFNLFGIKSSAAWDGKSAAVNSLEYKDGVAAMEKSSFRVYDSLASSFADYVDFLKSNPRYQQALDKVADAADFLGELQSAGYATDPGYAEKILGIVGRLERSGTAAGLKNF